MILSVTRNNTRNAYYLKCDIKKFFDSIDHEILKKILKKNIQDKEILNLIYETINSFNVKPNKGLPLGNYTSQLFSNIYMNEFDQYIKRKLRIKHYIRYCDDFIILDSSKENLEIILKDISRFLNERLDLKLHKEKIFINRISKGIDFLGHVVFPNHIILRTRTKKRIIKKFKKRPNKDSLASYVGITKHARASNIKRELNNIYFDSNDKSRF